MTELHDAARQFVGFGHPREALKLLGTASLTISNAGMVRRFLAAWPMFERVAYAITFRAVATARTEAVEAAFAARKSEREQSLAERSREAGEFGASFSDNTGMTKSGRVDAMWSRAVQKANAQIGATTTPAADTTPKNPSISDEERTALSGAAGLAGAALADLGRV